MTTTEEAPSTRKYRLIAELGHGGMADVYLAVAQGPAGFNKLVVLKKARKELAREGEFLAMFLDEARLAARLSHPNVVQTYEVGHDEDQYFIAMEYLDGQPLHRIRSKGLPLGMHIRILIDALAGLHHAHELTDFDGTPLGVVHRDATPQNIFVTYDGQVKVVDFGIAKALDSSTETKAGVIKGKVPYMAPEQVHGERIDRRADVFSIGVMLWESVTGRRMWKKLSDIAVLTKIGLGEIPSLAEGSPDTDPELIRICDKALAFKESDRYATALEMHEDLERFLTSTGQNVTAREVGKLIAEKFADDRARVKRVVEAELKDFRWSGQHFKITTAELPKLDLGPVQVTPTGQRPGAGSNPSQPSIRTTGSGSLHTANALVTSPAGTGADHAAAPPKPKAKLALLGAALLALASIAAGVKVLSSLAPPPPSGSGAASTSAAAPSQSAAPSPTTALLKIKIAPDKAKLTLDGALLGVGGYEGPIVRDGRTHTIRAEAPGFLAHEETITASADVALSWALERDSDSGSTAATASAAPQLGAWNKPAEPRGEPSTAPTTPAVATPSPSAPATAAPATTSTPGQKPKRQIDPNSPYNQ